MRLILLGVVLDVVAVLLIVGLIFVPMFVNDNASLNSFYARIFCETGDRYVPQTSSHETSDGGTGYNLYAVCVGERGTLDVTGKQTIIGMGVFAIPLMLGVALQIIGAKQLQHRRNRPREVTHLSSPSRPVSVAPSDNPISWGQQPASTAKTLSEKLAEADKAYEARLISRDEYEALRKRIIDESNF